MGEKGNLKKGNLGCDQGGRGGTPYDRLYGEASPKRYKKGYRKMFFRYFNRSVGKAGQRKSVLAFYRVRLMPRLKSRNVRFFVQRYEYTRGIKRVAVSTSGWYFKG